MQRKLENNKKLKWKNLAFLTIGLWLVRPIIFNIINIDYANSNVELLNDIVWMLLIPLAIGVISIDSFNKQINKSNGITGIIVAVVFTFFILLFLNLFNLCGVTYSDPIYKNSNNNSIICTRTYDCGAYDSSPTERLVEMNNYFGIIISYSDIEIDTIDKRIWIKQ